MLAFQQYHEIVVVVVRVSVTQNCHDFMAVFDGGGLVCCPYSQQNLIFLFKNMYLNFHKSFKCTWKSLE